MKRCRLCRERPATIPDRNAMPGRPIKTICLPCHQERLLDDLEEVMLAEQERRQLEQRLRLEEA